MVMQLIIAIEPIATNNKLREHVMTNSNIAEEKPDWFP